MNSNNNAFYLNFSLEQLLQMQESLANAVSSMQHISRYMLIDTGAPKSICSESWLSDIKWNPVKVRSLPATIKPFRFASHPIAPNYLACLVAKISDINGNHHYLRQVVFVLPSVPIPFLLGLQTQRSLGFDLCLRQQNGSHVCVSNWNATVPLSISSHLWLQFEPLDTDPQHNYDWDTLINQTLHSSLTDSNLVLPVDYPRPHKIPLTPCSVMSRTTLSHHGSAMTGSLG